MIISIFKTILVFIFYILFIVGITLSIFSFIGNDNLLLKYVDIVEIIVYSILLMLYILFLKKDGNRINFKVNLKFIFYPFLFALLYRIVEDPILRNKIILGKMEFPKIAEQKEINFILIFNTVIIIPIVEELFFRKIMINYFKNSGLLFGLFFSSLLFSIIHIESTVFDFFRVLDKFLFGILAGIIYIKWGLFFSVTFHIISNLIWYILFINTNIYFTLLKSFNFGYFYWFTIITSLILIYGLLNKIFKKDTKSAFYDTPQC